MKTMLRGIVAMTAGAGVLLVLSGCSSSKAPEVSGQNALLGSRNLIPPPYVRPFAPQGPFPLIPACGGEAVGVPAEPLPAEAESLAFVPVEEPVFVNGSGVEEVIVVTGSVEGEKAEPAQAAAVDPSQPVEAVDVSAKAAPIAESYTVKVGDTMGAIALVHGVRWQDIAGLNPEVDPNRMRIGSKLKMPIPGVTPSAPVERAPTAGKASRSSASVSAVLPADGVYTVVGGDNLSKLAHRFNVKISDIRAWNGLQNDILQIGQKLRLRADRRAAATIVSTSAVPAEVAPSAAPVTIPGLGDTGEVKLVVEKAPADAAVVADVPVVSATADAAVVADAPAVSAPIGGYVDAVISTDNETLENLAKMYATSVAEILRHNPQIKSDADLKRGTTLKIVHY